MRARREIEPRLLADRTDDDVVPLVTAKRHGGVRQIRNLQEQALEGRLGLGQSRFEPPELLTRALHLRDRARALRWILAARDLARTLGALGASRLDVPDQPAPLFVGGEQALEIRCAVAHLGELASVKVGAFTNRAD